MKKITIILLALNIGIMGFSQDSNRDEARNEVKKYMDEVVYPEIQKQLEAYMNELSDEEKSQIETICQQKGNRIATDNYRGRRNISMKNKGTGNNTSGRTVLLDEVQKITVAHPDQNKVYRSFIESNQEKWMKEMAKIHKENGIEPMKNKDGKTGLDVFFERASTPEWLLMWDPDNPRTPMFRSPRAANIKKGDKRNKNKIDPELRADKKAYVMENVVPVIAEERKKFDVNLSFDEKKVIETARQKIEVRRAMFKSWYESEDFVPGQRAKDPNFDNMREDMRNSMSEVREIALKYSDEIDNSLSNIRSHSEVWKNDMRDYGDKYGKGNGKPGGRKGKDGVIRAMSPVKFLLFDPAKAEDADFLGVKDDIRIVIYPNPVVQNATVAVIGAMDKNVTISLYSNDGEKIKDLYNALVKDERLEVGVSFDESENGIYFIKLAYDGNEITRKLIVK